MLLFTQDAWARSSFPRELFPFSLSLFHGGGGSYDDGQPETAAAETSAFSLAEVQMRWSTLGPEVHMQRRLSPILRPQPVQVARLSKEDAGAIATPNSR